MSEKDKKQKHYLVKTTKECVRHINNPFFETSIEELPKGKAPNKKLPDVRFRFVFISKKAFVKSQWLEESQINIIKGYAEKAKVRQNKLAKDANVNLFNVNKLESISYISLNGNIDGKRLPYKRNKNCELMWGHGEPEIHALDKHKKKGGQGTKGNSKYLGIYPIIKVHPQWVGKVTLKYKGILFTIERK